MSRLSNLLRQVETQDPQLATDLKREMDALSGRRIQPHRGRAGSKRSPDWQEDLIADVATAQIQVDRSAACKRHAENYCAAAVRRGPFARRLDKGIDKTGNVGELGDVYVERIEARDVERKKSTRATRPSSTSTSRAPLAPNSDGFGLRPCRFPGYAIHGPPSYRNWRKCTWPSAE